MQERQLLFKAGQATEEAGLGFANSGREKNTADLELTFIPKLK